ncbi:hypothetical protein SLEP1_g53376 [Rubroshorea leprosula]|uniref:Uncharacterized protein n=1 Tax=Rubroshorea leprosula TaxID=152421 RepID=A0AAV5M970_9ROSI|nr:hypothetical protein SLEP1_g53376 [Rubroshorea leprosula]
MNPVPGFHRDPSPGLRPKPWVGTQAWNQDASVRRNPVGAGLQGEKKGKEKKKEKEISF